MKELALLCSGYGRGVINLINNKNLLKLNIELIIVPKESVDLINLAIKNNIKYELIDNKKKLSEKNELVLDLMNKNMIDLLYLVGCDFRIQKKVLEKTMSKVLKKMYKSKIKL